MRITKMSFLDLEGALHLDFRFAILNLLALWLWEDAFSFSYIPGAQFFNNILRRWRRVLR